MLLELRKHVEDRLLHRGRGAQLVHEQVASRLESLAQKAHCTTPFGVGCGAIRLPAVTFRKQPCRHGHASSSKLSAQPQPNHAPGKRLAPSTAILGLREMRGFRSFSWGLWGNRTRQADKGGTWPSRRRPRTTTKSAAGSRSEEGVRPRSPTRAETATRAS